MKNPQMKTRSFNRHPKRSEPYACRIESNTVGSYSVVLSEGGSYRFHIAERVSAGDADEIARFVESSSGLGAGADLVSRRLCAIQDAARRTSASPARA